MSAALGLYRLQQVDSQIDGTQARQKWIQDTLQNDLNLRAAVYILDWDESWYKEKLSQAERSRNVLRFCRSMAKLKEKGLPFTERDQLFFLRAYWGDDKSIKTLAKRFCADESFAGAAETALENGKSI